MESNITLVASQNVPWRLRVNRAAQEQSGMSGLGPGRMQLAKGIPMDLALTRLF